MANKKLSASILIFSLLFFATFSNACHTCHPKPLSPTPTPVSCPKDALKLGVCANLLGGLVNLVVGASSCKCCTLIAGLADLEAAVCLCTLIKANVLGINLNVPLSLGFLVSACEKSLPPGFTC